MIAAGIDTGGTCTDAVLYDTKRKAILASGKAPTTHEALERGILAALHTLPRELLVRAGCLTLSTTLATNACVEHKGGRTCLILIGTDRKTTESVSRTYGFESTEFMLFLRGDPSKEIEPDWETLDAAMPELLAEYDSFAVSQFLPDRNNGAFEKECRRRIREKTAAPVICAWDSFHDRNMLRRGAGALLNARLLPVIDRFLNAVHLALNEEGLDLPVVIMRSDGSLVSESYSREYPVETILCGPTASVKGGCALAKEDNALIIDIGGTTTDIARVKRGEPVSASGGVSVAGWRTMVRGIEADTFALGGDTRICFRGGDLYLDERRAMPVSRLAAEHPRIIEELRELNRDSAGSGIPLYEYLILTGSIEGREERYTERERQICSYLSNGPLNLNVLCGRLRIDPYRLDTARLENEGILLRSGLTPTDTMVLDGSADFGSREAASLAVSCLEKCVRREVSLSAEVTALAEERLYRNLVRILWQDAHPNAALPKELDLFADDALKQYRRRESGGAETPEFFINGFSTDAVLIGVGAPVGRFLPGAAKALNARWVIPEHAGVCNALGAALGDVCARETVRIRVDYIIGGFDTEREDYIVCGREYRICRTMEEALCIAEQDALAAAEEKALRCGAAELYDRKTETVLQNGTSGLGTILLGAEVTATVRGRLSELGA